MSVGNCNIQRNTFIALIRHLSVSQYYSGVSPLNRPSVVGYFITCVICTLIRCYILIVKTSSRAGKHNSN